MVREFTLNLREFEQAIRQSPEVAGAGARRALGDIKDDWMLKARNIAPLDTSNLRRQIRGEVESRDDLNGQVTVTANASNKGFNYAYYIHEHNAGGKNLRTPGTVKKFLDDVGEANETVWGEMLEEEIKQALRDAGW